jgi:hypothetical protein
MNNLKNPGYNSIKRKKERDEEKEIAEMKKDFPEMFKPRSIKEQFQELIELLKRR